MDFNSQWIEIFRAGDYSDKGNWTSDMLGQVVSNFNSGAWKPPAVLGHPEHDSPAMGWVKELREEGGKLLARFENVHPALESLVAEGRYPNRSAAFYLNPQGNGPVLRHVGFLGAMPPEVKSLAPVQFSEGRFLAIEFQEASSVRSEFMNAPKGQVLMGEFPMPKGGQMRVKNVDLARRIIGLQLEAKGRGADLSFDDAKQIAFAEGFKLEV